MLLNNKQTIADRFGSHAGQYDQHAGLQARVAAELSSLMTSDRDIKLLEIGCGTGLFTEHLLGKYIASEFYITDLSQDMLDNCKCKIGNNSNITYLQSDGEKILEHPEISQQTFDVIATSMTIQWFHDLPHSLKMLTELLKPGGQLYFATIGANCFPEWRKALSAVGAELGTMDIPELPGIIHEQMIEIQHDDAFDFLKSLKALGASTPRAGYQASSAGKMRQALKKLDQDTGGKITWHIIYGKLEQQH